MRAKTVAVALCIVFFMCWPTGNQYAEDEAQTKANGYEVSWWNMAGGGGTSSGGSYELMGTVGQPGAGESSGGSYFLTSGYMAFAVTPIVGEIFSDGFETGNTSQWSSTTGL